MDYIHVAKNMGGIMSTYTKMSRRDYVREGFCPTLLSEYMCRQLSKSYFLKVDYGPVVFELKRAAIIILNTVRRHVPRAWMAFCRKQA